MTRCNGRGHMWLHQDQAASAHALLSERISFGAASALQVHLDGAWIPVAGVWARSAAMTPADPR
jgi:hypothetical protein